MQYKKISLYFNYFYKTILFFFKTIIISAIFSSCSTFLKEKKIFSNELFIKNTYENKNILKQKNKNINAQILENNKFVKKIIYIKKNSNFFKSAYQSGLNLPDINTIIKAIEWQINFRKLNINSRFDLIFLRKKTSSNKNQNVLLGIKLNNLRKIYYAIKASNGVFYNIEGINKSKQIMNFSILKKYRISSNFNLHRLHPITHHISQHLGIDLAIPSGTVIRSTSNGKVIKTAFNKISGFYIVLDHKNNCMTKYMHLQKFLVKVGQKVKINQKIALSGNTGRSTGPHLHYEIWMNKHAINPIHAKSNFIEQLEKKEKALFLKTSKMILLKLQ